MNYPKNCHKPVYSPQERLTQRHKKVAALLLLPLLLSTSGPAMASEQPDQPTVVTEAAVQKENTYTLAQIIQQIGQHNRIGQQYKLNLDLLEESHTKAKNTRKDVQSTLNSVYDKETDAYNSLGTVGQNQATVQQGLLAVQQQVTAAIQAKEPNLSSAQLQEAVKNELKTTLKI